ncbi:MAG: MFS transporter [Promethearchaeota archaeon]
MKKIQSKSGIILILSTSLLFTFTVWFSANAIIGQIETLWVLEKSDLALLSMILIFGFVAGGLLFGIFNLSDIIKTEYFYSINGLFAAIMNFLAIFSPNFSLFLTFRFLTGFFIAGVYPTAMKLMSSWFKENRGFAVGILLGALALGSGSPYIFNIIGTVPNWRVLLSVSSCLAVVGSIVVFFFLTEGPHLSKGAKFKFSNLIKAWSKKSVRLTNYAYFGHQWEIYAFWVWIPVYLTYVFNNVHPTEDPSAVISLVTFLIFLLGAIGNVIGGKIADKIGKRKFNIIMLVISGLCSILIGFFSWSIILSVLIAFIWGFTIVPDSAQYSVLISEFTDQQFVGTALTMQTTIGFVITAIPIQILPFYANLVSWSFGFTMLAIGPIFGLVSLFLLKKS